MCFLSLEDSRPQFLKKIEGDREEESPKTSGDSSRQTNKSSLGISFENKDGLDSAGSVFESYREPDRFSFACDQSAIVKAIKQFGDIKSPNSLLNENDSLFRTPINSLESPQTASSRNHFNYKSNDKQSLMDAKDREETTGTASGFTRRGSHPLIQDERIATANFERDSIVPLTKAAEKIFSTISKEPRSGARYQLEVSEGKEDGVQGNYIVPYDLVQSLVRDSAANNQNSPKEENAKSSLTASEKRPLKNPYARKKSSGSIEKSLSKSHNNSIGTIEFEAGESHTPKKQEEHHRSPYFKEMANK